MTSQMTLVKEHTEKEKYLDLDQCDNNNINFEDAEIMARQQQGNVKMPAFSAIKDFLECPFCLQIYVDPYRLQCGHRVCEVCLYSMTRDKTRTCPIDGMGIVTDKAVIDLDLKEKLKSVIAECPLAKKGCKWSGKIKDLEAHRRNCGFNEICCPKGCGSMIQKNHIARHAQAGCNSSLTRCKQCFSEMSTDQLKIHKCPCQRYRCPNGCGKQNMSLEELSMHTDAANGKCPAANVSCIYKEMGCSYVGTKDSMDKHVQSEMKEHLHTACKSLSKMKIEQEETSKKLQQQSNQMKTIQESFYEYTLLLKKIDAQQEEMQCKIKQQESVIKDQAKQLASKDVIIDQLQSELAECSEYLCEAKYGSSNGTLLWRIDSFREKLNQALSQKNFSMYSPAFYTSKFGYKLCAQLFPAGCGENNTHYMSIYFHLMSTEHDDVLRWPFSHKISFTLLDQAENPDEANNISYTIVPAANAVNYQKPIQRVSEGRGCHRFVSLCDIENRNYIKNNNVFIKIKVLQKG
eukprot:gene3024-3483_t